MPLNLSPSAYIILHRWINGGCIHNSGLVYSKMLRNFRWFIISCFTQKKRLIKLKFEGLYSSMLKCTQLLNQAWSYTCAHGHGRRKWTGTKYSVLETSIKTTTRIPRKFKHILATYLRMIHSHRLCKRCNNTSSLVLIRLHFIAFRYALCDLALPRVSLVGELSLHSPKLVVLCEECVSCYESKHCLRDCMEEWSAISTG